MQKGILNQNPSILPALTRSVILADVSPLKPNTRQWYTVVHSDSESLYYYTVGLFFEASASPSEKGMPSRATPAPAHPPRGTATGLLTPRLGGGELSFYQFFCLPRCWRRHTTIITAPPPFNLLRSSYILTVSPGHQRTSHPCADR